MLNLIVSRLLRKQFVELNNCIKKDDPNSIFEQNPRIRTLKKKTSYCRILVSTIGGFIMSGKKGMKHYSSVIIDDVIKLKSEGKTNKEIVEIFGLANIKTVKNIVQLYNQKQRALAAGISPKKRGRTAKGYQITEDGK